MRQIARRRMELGSVAAGPGRYALGRGYLTLDRPDDARRELERAVQIDYRTPEVSYALGLAYGQLYQQGLKYVVMPFDEILEAVRDGKVDAGLLIHEGQLTYADEGLRLLVDLGVWWYERTGGLPLPLGGNLIRRDLGPAMMKKVSRMLHASIAHALNNRADALEYAKTYGRGLAHERIDTFVGMYVNDLTLDYGERGRTAVRRLFDEAWEKKLVPAPVNVEFVGAND
jgi:1,4-dihydroxy-6-naphthoate synthase